MKNNKRKEQRRRKKIFLAILMILFVGVVLTASTYAWFTSNRTVTVENIDINVAASNGLQLSVNASEWKPYINKADITGVTSAGYSSAVNQVPNSMVPVSTIGGTEPSTGYMLLYKGEVIGGSEAVGRANILTAARSAETTTTTETGDFVAFDLFFKVTEDNTIYLTDKAKVTANGTSKGIENSARIAFVIEGHGGVDTSAAIAQTWKTPQTPIIWEPNNDAHTSSAITHASNVYGRTVTNGGAADSIYGVKAAIPQAADVLLNSRDSQYFAAVTPTISTTSGGISSAAYEEAFQLEAGITKVRVYMWIEGQDVDCEDAASGSDLTYSLQFSIDDKAS